MADKAIDILKRIKAMFDAPDPSQGAPSNGQPSGVPATNPASPNGAAAKTAQYNVDGGQPVFVNISDDGIADIDQNDTVFSDAALSVPYPDGTFKVTGTDFSFTVMGGVVTAIDDKDGKGAGTPVQAAPAASPAPAAPVAQAAAPALPNFSTQESMKAELEKFKGKFANGGSPTLSDLAIMVQALFENVFGYQIAQVTAAEAIASYKDSFAAQDKVIREQNEKLQKQETILKGIFEIVEQIAELPAGSPVETPKKASVFHRQPLEDKEKRMISINAGLKKLNPKQQ